MSDASADEESFETVLGLLAGGGESLDDVRLKSLSANARAGGVE